MVGVSTLAAFIVLKNPACLYPEIISNVESPRTNFWTFSEAPVYLFSPFALFKGGKDFLFLFSNK